MSFRNPLNRMFETNTEHWARLIADVDAQDAAAQAENTRTTDTLAEALAAENPDADLIVALRAKRKTLAETREELRVVRDHYVLKLAEAQEAEYAAEHAKELAERKKAAETKNRSFVQGVGDVNRAIDKLHALLPQIHEAREEAFAAAERLEVLAGYSVFDIDDMIRAAGPAYALGELIHPYAYDRHAEHERLDTAFATAAASAKDNFALAIGLKQPAPPTPEDIAAAEEAAAAEEERQQQEAEHQRRLETDPAYARQFYPKTGAALPIPHEDTSERRKAETILADQMAGSQRPAVNRF